MKTNRKHFRRLALEDVLGNNVLYFSFKIPLWPSSPTHLRIAHGTDKWAKMVWGPRAYTTASWPLYHFISINGTGYVGV